LVRLDVDLVGQKLERAAVDSRFAVLKGEQRRVGLAAVGLPNMVDDLSLDFSSL
jgi:hypothetical protein